MGRIRKRGTYLKSRLWVFFNCFLLLFAGLTVYAIHSSFEQLVIAFDRADHFIPTRIFSDLSRIGGAQSRASIEERLSSLAYQVTELPQEVHFKLHPVDYPTYLLPHDHVQADSNGAKHVRLLFDRPGLSGSLQSLLLNEQEISEVFLEPEAIATLARGNNQDQVIRSNLRFDEIPAPIWKAIIAIEDQNFLDHRGLELKSLVRALWVNLKTHSFAQGGSTITQQLVKNLMVRRNKNLIRKLNETLLSVLLELKFEKEHILERYLNEVYLGQVGKLEVHGVGEGAQYFFGKKLEELSLAEAALMAGLIRGPSYYSPYRYRERAVQRQQLVLQKMVETNQVAPEEAQAAMREKLSFAPAQTASNKAAFFVDYVKAELNRLLKKGLSEEEINQSGFRVYTSLDMNLSRLAQAAVKDGILSLEKKFQKKINKIPAAPSQNTLNLEGALACVDHTTGQIRALIGGKNYAQNTFNRILNMKRQVGSTFKPIVYLAALEKKENSSGVPYGGGYPIEDAPWSLDFDSGRQSWTPQNYGKLYSGWITMKTALSLSINVAAAKLGQEVGIDRVIDVAKRLGVESPLPKVPSLSLGAAELSPIELLRVYSTIANRGIQEELTVIRAINYPDGTAFARVLPQEKQVFETAEVDLLIDFLQEVLNSGTAKSIHQFEFEYPAAGKTGTTNNYRDAWFAGFTPYLTTVVWVGTDQNNINPPLKKTFSLTGSNAALPIWTDFMKKALKDVPPLAFPASPYLVDVSIDRHTGQKASDECPPSQITVEKYIRGNEPKISTCSSDWPRQEGAGK